VCVCVYSLIFVPYVSLTVMMSTLCDFSHFLCAAPYVVGPFIFRR
jgi:hypothetical protein